MMLPFSVFLSPAAAAQFRLSGIYGSADDHVDGVSQH